MDSDNISKADNIPEANIPASDIIVSVEPDIFVTQLIQAKKTFDEYGDFKKNIETMTNNLDNKVCSKNFNPHNNNTTLIYDIMDDIQTWQSDMGKIFKKCLQYKEASELFEATIGYIFNELEKNMLISPELKNATEIQKFKNIDEKKAWISMELNKKYDIGKYIRYANKHKIQSEYILKQAQKISDVIESQDAKISRKISMIHEEMQMGILKAPEVKI